MTNVLDKKIVKLWAIARASTMYKFHECIYKFRENHIDSFIQIYEIKKLAFEFFLGHHYTMLIGHTSKSMNSLLKYGHDLSIIFVIEMTRMKIAEQFYIHYKIVINLISITTSIIKDGLVKAKEKDGYYGVFPYNYIKL